MGRRGEGYVIIQFLLLFLIAFAPDWGPLNALTFLRPIGAVFLGFALLLGGWSLVALGRNLTPLPHPREENQFVRKGPYRIVRHPMYGAVLLLAFGWSLYGPSLVGLLLSIGLMALFDVKARREEVWLAERHPEYVQYKEKVRKLIPWIY
jgi:protein-S-isoprenylcysteine O-methyltransferase Ste14